MKERLEIDILQAAIAGNAAALRSRRRLQPAGGPGDKVFPPTFAGAVYAVEQRSVPGRDEPVTCVLLDSVQSQANRMELALQDAIDRGEITLPLIEVDFRENGPTGDVDADIAAGRLIDPVGKVTSLQVPHRLADAILRDSELDGEPFRKSAKGKALNTVSLNNATPLFELCPTALIFGMWDSTGPKGGLGAKFERAMVSEVVGIGAEIHDTHRARGVRRDPLEIRKGVPVSQAADKTWKVVDGNAKGTVRPSELNHSSVPFDSENAGVTIEFADQVTTLSLISLRRLRFPPHDDLAARTVLAALGLCAATLAFESGMGLRSRCLLWPDEPMSWELLEKPGSPPAEFSLTGKESVELLQQAIERAKSAGLAWPDSPITLKPSAELLKLVQRSQLLATQEQGGEAD
ncbi:MAG: type I-U CRISPR-associated protein Cas7 [Bryobacterales bacterium]|nr:type I-U CRISPR-associated protein Cas7 [Bryobacterales bacterium]